MVVCRLYRETYCRFPIKGQGVPIYAFPTIGRANHPDQSYAINTTPSYVWRMSKSHQLSVISFQQ